MFDSLYPQAKRLYFPKHVEQGYREDYFANTISSTRIALILGIVLYSLFGILDLFAVPISWQSAWIIRYGIVVPLFVLTLAISYVQEMQEYIQPVTCFSAIMAGLGVSYMIAITNEVEYGNRFYVTGLLLISVWSYSLARLRFGYAVLANLIIILGYEYVAIHVKQYLGTETGTVIFTINNFFLIGTTIIGTVTSYALERYTRIDYLQKMTIQDQRDQADRLLYNILPERIAERLKHSNDTIAEEFSSATVLVADIVNFTPISAHFGPREVVDMLNDLFTRFDELVDKYNVEKIQVAGDGYMVAAGVPTPRPDHAVVLVRLAMDMLDIVKHGNFLGGKHPIELRIGLSSGSVLGGVIGRRKYFYAIWGDVVNTAARMESHGSIGKIQITRATYELIKDEFECEYIGEIPVKGKGQMEVWHLIAEKSERSPSHA
jgi:class 3 adenylate cyclase